MRIQINRDSSRVGHLRLRSVFADESGSISVMIIGLTVFALTLSVGILDLSDAFLAKRELIQISEEATQRAAHEISLADYYSGNFEVQGSMKVPIDCARATDSVSTFVERSQLREQAIVLNGTECDGFSIGATLSSSIRPIVDFPLLDSIFGGKFQITATTSAASIIPGS